MFNMNPFEMVVIGIIALVVVGPRGLPELGRMVGKWMRTFREAADEMKRGLYFEDDYRSSTPRRIPSSPVSEPRKTISPSESTDAVVVSQPQTTPSETVPGQAAAHPSGEDSSRPPLIPPYNQDPAD